MRRNHPAEIILRDALTQGTAAMDQRRPMNFCADCGKPISNTAVRCQRCAMRSRANTAPPSTKLPEDVVLRRWNALTPEEITQIRDADSDLQAAITAHRLNIDPEVVRTIRGSRPNAVHRPAAPDTPGNIGTAWAFSSVSTAEHIET
jgi:hypothetical protein